VLWTALFAALALVLALLAVPVDVALAARRRDRLETRVTVRWWWGRVCLPMSKGGPKARKARKPKKPRKARKPGRPSGARRALALLRSPDFPRRVIALVRGLLARVHVRRLELAVRLGLDDPADTGRLWGVVGPAAALLNPPAPARVEVAPEFGGALFHLDAAAEARVVPAAVLGTVVAFLLSPVTLRAMRAAARGTP
jgi:hypothetical protein